MPDGHPSWACRTLRIYHREVIQELRVWAHNVKLSLDLPIECPFDGFAPVDPSARDEPFVLKRLLGALGEQELDLRIPETSDDEVHCRDRDPPDDLFEDVVRDELSSVGETCNFFVIDEARIGVPSVMMFSEVR